MAFADSANKQAVRNAWDLPLLAAWADVTGRKLTYFGMPGPRMLDLLAWKGVLDSRRTAIEERPKSPAKRALADDAAAQLMHNSIKAGLSDGLQILRGDVGEIITGGLDNFAVRPLLCEAGGAAQARFRYDLHNLDFDGGLAFINKVTGEAPRLDALRKLVERQKGASFILFLTINVRNTVGPAIADYLERLVQMDAGGHIGWYLGRGKGEVEQRLKAIVPLLMRGVAESNGFALKCLPPLAYTGHQNARMVHFVFEFHAEDLVFAGVSKQLVDAMLTLPMLEAVDGQIGLAPLQHPACQPMESLPLLGHLEHPAATAFLSQSKAS